MAELEPGWCFRCNGRQALERQGVNHLLHAFLTIGTVGVWGIAWLLACLSREPWQCRNCGSRDVQAGEWEGEPEYSQQGGSGLIWKAFGWMAPH